MGILSSLVENVGEGWQSFSIRELSKGNFESLFALFYLIIMIAVYSVAIYHFYRYIARRDRFKPSKLKYTTTIGFLKYFFLFPFVASIFFMGFSIILISLSKGDATSGFSIASVLSISFALVLAIRITSYYTEDLSKDVAKMLPFAILGVFLVDSTYFRFGEVTARVGLLSNHINEIVQFLILIILAEWLLRVGLAIRYKIIPKKEKVTTE